MQALPVIPLALALLCARPQDASGGADPAAPASTPAAKREQIAADTPRTTPGGAK